MHTIEQVFRYVAFCFYRRLARVFYSRPYLSSHAI